ncbi:MAG: hypothetical protein AAGA48_14700 [Myxococcota bacterium]
MARGFMWMTMVGGLLPACSGPTVAPEAKAPDTHAEKDANTDTPPVAPPSNAHILSAYHGLDRLPPRVLRICPGPSVRKDGMPVTFSVRLDGDTLSPEDFSVETAAGETVTPTCATLLPADEPLERRTVLLAGTFGTAEAPPRSVKVVGDLKATNGASIKGLRTTTITPLAAGPSLLLAERFSPTTPGLAGECPPATQQVVQLTWQGGVTGPQGAELGEAQRTSVTVTLEDGSTVTPLALADDDPDNVVHVCLDVATRAQSVSVSAGHFHDPGDDANPETRIEVISGVPSIR